MLHFPRRKDRQGKTLEPTQVLLVAACAGGAQIPVPPDWLPQLRSGDTLRLTDAGERERSLVVRGSSEGGVLAECDRSLYVTSGLPLVWRRGDRILGEGRVGAVPKQPRNLSVSVGDSMLLNESGECADLEQRVLAFPEPGLLGQVRQGERVILDDGKVVAVVETAGPDELMCRVTQTLVTGAAPFGQGHRVPGQQALPPRARAPGRGRPQFALTHADGVEVSFVSTSRDVARIGERLKAAGRAGFGMILKLETRGPSGTWPLFSSRHCGTTRSGS